MPKKRGFDQLLLVTVLITMGVGVVMIYNASAMIAIKRFARSVHFRLMRIARLMPIQAPEVESRAQAGISIGTAQASMISKSAF